MEKYQITKTIRFKLEKVNAPRFEEEVQRIGNIKEAEASLAQLVTMGQDLSSLLKEFIYVDKDMERKKLKKTVTVHFRWLREFTKDKYFEWILESPQEEQSKKATGSFAALAHLRNQKPKKINSKEKQFKLSDLKYLPEVFQDFLYGWDANVKELANAISRPKESLTRKAEIGKIVLKFTGRSMYLFLEHFISESKDKDNIIIEGQLKEKIKTFKEVLDQAQKWTMPSQSAGVELAKASFNYYTINKKEKDFVDERNGVEDKLKKYDQRFVQDISQKENKLLETLEIIKKDETAKNHKFLYKMIKTENNKLELQKTEDGEIVTLDLLYQIMKLYRAEQISKFNELIVQNCIHDDLEKKSPLLAPYSNKKEENINAFNKYKELTTQIQRIANQINTFKNDGDKVNKFKSKKEDIVKTRGKLLFHTGLKTDKKDENDKKEILKFERYLKFCKIYKDIAMKRGKLIARLKGIEKEKIDSQRLQYWSFVLENKEGHQVVLIPKAKARDVYQKISAFNESKIGSPAVYYFESLTYRALRKLCFKIQDNTFQEAILDDPNIQKKWKDCFERNSKSDKRIGEHLFKTESGVRDEKSLIEFYKDVLCSNYVSQNREDGKIILPASFDKEVLIPEFSTEQEFRMALEKCCYMRKKIVPKDELDKILSTCNAQIFSITSYDLRKKNKSNFKAHTKLWLKFWEEENEQNRFPLRLNPEIKITWREPKATRVKKYGKGTELHDERKKNRYLHPQFTLAASFLENALDSEKNYRFLDAKEKKKNVKDFNDQIKKFLKPKEELWLYGIDTGIVELASLCLIQKNETPQMFEVLELKEDKMDYEKTGFLKDGTPKQYKAIQNLSYFLNKELYRRTFKDDKFQEAFNEIFKGKEVPALDLSVAKVISGKIVINGDISARLNVSLSNARRKIVEALIQNPNAQLSEEDYKIKIGNEIIFKGRKEFNSIKPWEKIQEILKESFQKDKENPARVQEDINRYQKVIAANITGVIYFLYKKFPGVITIEYLDQTEIESHQKQFEGIVDNPVEKALYRKFQTEGLVPPVSELWSIKAKDSQVGIIYYGDSKNEKNGTHGLRCPNCGKKAYASSKDSQYDSDKKKKIFQCKCGYHNHNTPMNRKGLDSNDKVAAYNIAKRGLEIVH